MVTPPATRRVVAAPGRAFAVLLACALSLPAGAALTVFPDFDRELAAHGVERDYTDEGQETLIGLVGDEIAGLRARAGAAEERERKKLERTADAVAQALERLAAVATSPDHGARAAAFAALKSLLYSVRAEARPARRGITLGVIFGFLRNLSLELPWLSPAERLRPLDSVRAERESVNLVDPRTGREYVERADLAGLSSDEVSRLDVRHDNHAWYTESELRRLQARNGSGWSALERRIESRIADRLGEPYDLERARRLLLFDGIDDSGTSPKVDTEDLQGQEWSLRWGEEVQTSALATRLYVELGAKFADLVHANHGPGDLLLVLDAAGVEETHAGCDEIATVERLRRCLLESEYEFDVSAYLVGHGVITEETLRQAPFSTAAGDASRLLGRHYVTFNESLVELKTDDDDFLRLGAAPLSSSGALGDRAKRGLVVFTYWIRNKDGKDDNNKGVIDRGSATYIDYMHDLGASLGNLRISGNPNLLRIGDGFAQRRGPAIRFSENMLYVPAAFERATHADAVWMARKIVELPRQVILDAVAATRWPDFQQEAMASRLIGRRNTLARLFDLGDPLPWDAGPRVVPLGSVDDRRAAVRRYRLALATEGDEERAVALLEAFMRDAGLDVDGDRADLADEVTAWADERDGASAGRVLETRRCRDSVVVALLESTVHPAGLSRRVQRRSDDEPLETCRPVPIWPSSSGSRSIPRRSSRLVRER